MEKEGKVSKLKMNILNIRLYMLEKQKAKKKELIEEVSEIYADWAKLNVLSHELEGDHPVLLAQANLMYKKYETDKHLMKKFKRWCAGIPIFLVTLGCSIAVSVNAPTLPLNLLPFLMSAAILPTGILTFLGVAGLAEGMYIPYIEKIRSRSEAMEKLEEHKEEELVYTKKRIAIIEKVTNKIEVLEDKINHTELPLLSAVSQYTKQIEKNVNNDFPGLMDYAFSNEEDNKGLGVPYAKRKLLIPNKEKIIEKETL